MLRVLNIAVVIFTSVTGLTIGSLLIALLVYQLTGKSLVASSSPRSLSPDEARGCVSSEASITENCKSSIDEQLPYKVEPIKINTLEYPLESIASTLARHPYIKLQEVNSTYVHLIWQSPLLGFQHDIELWNSGDKLHIRSISRSDIPDLRTNRHHIEWVRSILTHHKSEIKKAS